MFPTMPVGSARSDFGHALSNAREQVHLAGAFNLEVLKTVFRFLGYCVDPPVADPVAIWGNQSKPTRTD